MSRLRGVSEELRSSDSTEAILDKDGCSSQSLGRLIIDMALYLAEELDNSAA